MNSFIFTIFFIVSLFSTSLAVAQNFPAKETSWNIKYFLFIDTQKNFQADAITAKKENASSREFINPKKYLKFEELLLPNAVFKVNKKKSIGVVLIQFDREGRVLNKLPHASGFRAIRDELNHFSFIELNGEPKHYYDFGFWDTAGDPLRPYLPAACSDIDMDRYARPWSSELPEGAVGCREWTAQLYHKQQPYIDVTTYNNGRSFIGKLMGWARFEDSPKPVIGRHGTTWLCLHDCPAGERPGIIPNILKWTRKHGYPVPVEKLEQPEYLDSETED